MRLNKLFTHVAPLSFFAALLAFPLVISTASAAQFNVPAQVCQYMNVNQAKKLEFRSEGVLNTNTAAQWVVCPIATESFGGDVDVIARINNPTDTAATVQCVFKLTDAFGRTRRNINNVSDEPVQPGETVSFIVSNLDFDNTWTLTVSCKLPPGFLAVSFTVET